MSDTAASGRKRAGKKKRARADGGAVPEMLPPTTFTQDVDVIAIGNVAPDIDPMNPESIDIPNDDGTVTIEFPLPEPPKAPPKFDDNLAEHLDNFILGRIVETLLEGIENDERDRSEWLQQRADGLDLLGYKIEKPGAANVGSSSTAVAGQATARDGLLGFVGVKFLTLQASKQAGSHTSLQHSSSGDKQ